MPYIFFLTFLASIFLLILGLIKPERIVFVTRKTLSRKKIAQIFISTTVISFIMVGVTAPPVEEQETSTNKEILNEEAIQEVQNGIEEELTTNKEAEEVKIEESNGEQVDIPEKQEETKIEEPKEIAGPEQSESNEESAVDEPQYEYYKVTYVVDGDTVDVDMNGTTERLRLIGIDTPETKHPSKPVECFGKEASAKAAALLSGQMVRLEADSTQGERDKYGRLLRYVHRQDGLHFNKWMIEQGYAYEYTYSSAYKYQGEFKAAQGYAQSNKLGLWADNVCDDFNTPIEESTTPESTNTDTSSGSSGGQDDSTAPSEQCDIKGNINSKGKKLYHSKGCPSYNRTKIDLSKGERWFCSAEEAVNAGWEMAGNC